MFHAQFCFRYLTFAQKVLDLLGRRVRRRSTYCVQTLLAMRMALSRLFRE